MLRIRVLAVAIVTAAGSGTSDPGESVTPPATDTPVLTRTVVVQGLSGAWDVALATDGAMFYTERCRGLTVRRADGTTTRLFGTNGSTLVASDLVCEGQSGVHGVALAVATSTVNASLPAVRYRGLTLGPDGNLYVVTDTGEIWRVTPSTQ